MPGKRAFGATFGTYAGGVLTNVAQITKISPYKAKADQVDVSSHDSPAAPNGAGWREKISAMLEMGGMTLDLNYDPNNATHTALETQLGVSQVFKCGFPSATPAVVLTISGNIESLGPELPFDNKMTATVTVQTSGAPAFGVT